jgi:hypothetical protein
MPNKIDIWTLFATKDTAILRNVIGSPEAERTSPKSVITLAEIANPHQPPNANHRHCPRIPYLAILDFQHGF